VGVLTARSAWYGYSFSVLIHLFWLPNARALTDFFRAHIESERGPELY